MTVHPRTEGMLIRYLARLAGCGALLSAAVASAQPQPVLQPTIAEAQAANLMLTRAAEALGGRSRLVDGKSLDLDYRGTVNWLYQGPTPSEPTILDYRLQSRWDWSAKQALVQIELDSPSFSARPRVVLPEQPGQNNLIELALVSPHAVVRHLLSQPLDLTSATAVGGERTVIGPLYGRRVSLTLDENHLPKRLQHFINEDVQGDAARVVEYSDYSQVNGWRVPQRVRQIEGGRVVQELRLSAFEVDAREPKWASDLAVPTPTPASAPAQARPPTGMQAVELAPGIHLLQRIGGAGYNGMLVELDDGLMVLETPRVLRDGSELKRVAAAISAKPILYAVPTHHHDDHASGAAMLARSGATILTTPGNVDFFTRMATSPRSFAGWGPPVSSPRVRALAPEERIGPVQFLNVGSSHAAEHLIFYFPDQGILFQSDMGTVNEDGSVEAARAQGCALLAYIEKRGLPVRQIVGGHGKVGDLDTLRKSTTLEGSACLKDGASGTS